MSTYAATASLTPMGAEITWLTPAEGPARATIVTLVEELRVLAQRTPAGEVSVLISDMNERAQFDRGKTTVITVDKLGSPRFVPVDGDEWEKATAPEPEPSTQTSTSPSPQPQQPAPQPGQPLFRDPAPAPGSIDSLFGQSFGTAQTQIAALPEVTVVTANTKGGAGKTPVAIAVVAAAAELAGHNDLALVDVNPSGNLAEHTVKSSPSNIIALAAAAANPEFGKTRSDLDPFINWQPGGWITVTCPHSIVSNDGGLISDLTDTDVRNVVRALRHHCRFLLFDTGNNAKDPAWQSVVRNADKILVPVQWDPDTVIEAQRMITDMAAAGHQRLKERIIFIGTHSPAQRPERKRAKQYRQALTTSGWRVMDLPPDRHIAAGGIIEWKKLSKRTRAAATSIVQALLP